MTSPLCPFEAPLLDALRDNTLPDRNLPPALDQHLLVCSACRQTHAAARLLHTHAASIYADLPLPPAPDGIWRMAKQQQQQQSLRHAALAMLLMRALGIVYMAAVALWSLRALWQAQPAAGRGALHTLATGTAPQGVAIAVCLLVLGSTSLVAIGHRTSRQLLP